MGQNNERSGVEEIKWIVELKQDIYLAQGEEMEGRMQRALLKYLFTVLMKWGGISRFGFQW